MPDVLSRRALNRATLARQLLLERAELPIATAVEQLLGLNAQEANLPYLALWSRLAGFRFDQLTAAIEDRSVVRSTMMRATQHLVSVPDFRLLRPLLAPLLTRVQRNAFGARTTGVDLDALVTEARELLSDGRVLTRPDLGRQLARSRPDADPTALGWTVQYLLPLVHPAPSGTWNVRGATPFALAAWTGIRPGPDPDADRAGARETVRRYLAAFGPASESDIRAWSGIAGLREVVDELRPELRTLRDETGRELVDLPAAPLPDPDTPAPVRLLPEFDAPLLAFADRTRIMTDEVRRQVCVGAGVAATVLVDGTVAATWTVSRPTTRSARKPGTAREPGTARLAVRPLRQLTRIEQDAIEAEVERLRPMIIQG